jgi:quercetin dioxygenase-like cupin family protein
MAGIVSRKYNENITKILHTPQTTVMQSHLACHIFFPDVIPRGYTPARKERAMHQYLLTLLVIMFSVSGVVGQEPVKVDTKGLVAKIKFESVLAGFLTELNDKYKLRVTELTLEPGGYVGEHNHVGPGIRLVTAGQMTYVLPDKTVVYGPGEFFFESGDINHTVYNKTDAPMVHLLFEILPTDLKGPSLMPVKAK